MEDFVGTRIGRSGMGTKVRGVAVDARQREKARQKGEREEEERGEKRGEVEDFSVA